jgi:hypothetical protein
MPTDLADASARSGPAITTLSHTRLIMQVRWFIVLLMLALSACGENIQKGEKGDQGPAGPEGAPGPVGAAGKWNNYSFRRNRMSPNLLCCMQRE